jgi:hypothetical protein
VFKAVAPGAAGNGVTVTIAKVQTAADAGKATFDLAVAERAEFPDLSTDKTADRFVGKVLGPPAAGAAGPPLVQLKAAPADSVPYPKAGTFTSAEGKAVEIAVPTAADDKATAFTLVTSDKAPVGPVAAVEVKAADAGKGVFALSVTRTTSKAGAKLGELLTPASASAKAFAHAVTVEAPAGKPVAVPAPGTYTLAGGAEAQKAAQSSVTVFTNG